MNIFKKIWKSLDNSEETFMLITIYFVSIILNLFSLNLIWEINFFEIRKLNLLFGIILFLIIFFSTLNFLIKVIAWINLKPTLTRGQLKKKIKKLRKLDEKRKKEKSKPKIRKIEKEENRIAEEIRNHKVENNTFLQFVFFSTIVISTTYAPFFWTWRMIFLATKKEIRYLINKEKEKPSHAWGKSLDKNKKAVLYTCYI